MELVLGKDFEINWKNDIGSGAYSKVFSGLRNGSEVAVKLISLKGKNEKEEKRREEGWKLVQKEVEVINRLQEKEWFVGMEGWGIDISRDCVFVVSELMSCGSLFDFLHQKTFDISSKKGQNMSLQISKGIRYLQRERILHCDLTSLNILVNEDHCAKISDFGRCAILGEKKGKEEKEEWKEEEEEGVPLDVGGGSAVYQPPELFSGKKFTLKGDLYSLGMVLWELFVAVYSGKYKAPFSEYEHLEMDFQILVQAAKYDLRPTIPSSVPSCYQHIIESLWNPLPSKRPGIDSVIEILEKGEEEGREK